MTKSFVTGFSRIGQKRELKFALEAFWAGKTTFSEVGRVAKELRTKHWELQKNAGIDYISVNDFSFYDGMLDAAVLFGALPKRFSNLSGETAYFAAARGNKEAVAMEMTKWFNTNYHYIVPELAEDTKFELNPQKILAEISEAKELGVKNIKLNLVGPITFLALSKSIDASEPLHLLSQVTALYAKLLDLVKEDVAIVQFDEPIFVTSRGAKLTGLIKKTYDLLNKSGVKILFNTFFEHATEALKEVVKTDIYAVGLDFVYGEQSEALNILSNAKQVLFAGLIDGRNIWRADLSAKLSLAEKIVSSVGEERVVVGTSCSLLHVPFSLEGEEFAIKEWLSFGVQKLDEVGLLARAINGRLSDEDAAKFKENSLAIASRRESNLIHNKTVQERCKNLNKFQRDGELNERLALQAGELNLPVLPTTTIGSFPQTNELRAVRNAFKKGVIDEQSYKAEIKRYIQDCVTVQESIGLDVLVHGEPERNDMVEYFGEQLSGYAFSKNGWVQSYGSRCVKPPLLFGDVSRPKAMSVEWITYAQSLTKKTMKGMLTGPVTIMNWSFVRDDLARSEVAKQLSLAIYDEICDLQETGIKIIQVDEAAFKEGYPLRDENIAAYEKFAVDAFKISVSGAWKKTQIHTHMCYSAFNDIIATIEAMDADVISIETARSGNKLLHVFKKFGYKAQIGPGVYDIHSPRVPSQEEIEKQIDLILEVLPVNQLWINPDCGLKTRKWEEVKPSLEKMVLAVKAKRKTLA